jgi:NAD(P)-dependent dehydrogenase (short-subunit alcohol dehydrogenase family)
MAMNDRRTVLVTGAGTGIGRAIALAFAEEGYRVAAADLDESAAAATVEAAGGGAIAVQADVGDVADIDRMVSTVVAEFGHLDVIVNNAGVTRGAYIMNLTEDDWDRMHRVNAKGVFFCLQRAAQEMIPRREGRIINIASIAGRGFPGTSNAAYAASKGAVISLTKTAAQQLARHNLNVNAICPGVTMTEMVTRLVTQRAEKEGISVDEARAAAVKPIPLRRANDPADIAAMAVFLASPGARNITGQCYNVDGGLVTS